MRRMTLNEPPVLRQSIRAAVASSRDQRLLHQLHCVLLVSLGRSCHEVALWFGDSTRTVERWVHAFETHGAEGLRAHCPSGRPPKLPVDHVLRLAADIAQSPAAFGYAETQWSGRLLMRHLATRYGVTMSLRQCQRTLQRLTPAEPEGRSSPASAF
ncbi:MAG: helix-turn-helix domain-containing protein [Betaproteobacteria bacterium]